MKTLDVVAVVSNPCRYQSRYRLYRDFAHRVLQTGARLTTVEAAFGDRPYEVTDSHNPRHVQVRTAHELWHKENLINLGISKLPLDWEAVAWVDADLTFARPDWVEETLKQLDHYHVVQMFSHAQDLGPNHETLNNFTSFGYCYTHNFPVNFGGKPYTYWHPGFAWAARREFIDRVGGLMDWTLLGAADHMMAIAVIGHPAAIPTPVRQKCPNYLALAEAWKMHASSMTANLGYVPGTIMHHFHGAKRNRKYVERWEVLYSNSYDPLVDIKRDWQGVLQLSGNKPKLRDDIRTYFRQRNEDSIDV